MQMDYKTIATMFGRGRILLCFQSKSLTIGSGATYDAIEGHFRKIKRVARSLPDEHCDSTSPPPTPSAAKGQRKARATTTAFEGIAPRQKTLVGRITKSRTKNSPAKAKKGTVPVGADREKREILDEVVQSSSTPMAAHGFVENRFEALMGGWQLGMNSGAGDIFMGLPGVVGSDMGVDGPGG